MSLKRPHTFSTLDSSKLLRTKISYVKMPTLNVIRFSFIPNYNISHLGAKVLSDSREPLRVRVASRTLARSREGLWVYYSPAALLDRKAVVRHWCQRRVKTALLEELQKRGFDKDGKRAKHGMERGVGGKAGFCGTLEINLSPKIAVAEWGEVRRQVGLMVERMEEMSMSWAKENKSSKTIGSSNRATQLKTAESMIFEDKSKKGKVSMTRRKESLGRMRPADNRLGYSGNFDTTLPVDHRED